MNAGLRLLVGLLATVAGCTCGSKEGGQERPDGHGEDVIAATAKLIYVEGNVRVKRAGSMEWIAASDGQELAIDDKLRTLRDSFATIEFVEGGSLRVGPESLVSVTDLRLEPRSQARRVTFTLVEGKVEAELDTLDAAGSEFKVRTPTAEASVLRREVAFQ